MAAVISDIANGISTTNDGTLATGATVTALVGSWLVLVIASANSGTNGAPSLSGVVDSDGVNTYVSRAQINNDPGAAAAGATLDIFTCEVVSALSLDTITVSYSPTTAQKAIQVYLVVPGVGEVISFIAADVTGTVTSTSPYAAPTVSVLNGDTIFGGAAIETDDAITGDSDTTNGLWSAVITRLADGGLDAASMSSVSQYKTVNATGNQSWACTTTNRDGAATYLVIRSAVEDTIFAQSVM